MVGTNSPVSVRLDVDTRERLNALANRLESTPHALMRQAVAEFVEKRSTASSSSNAKSKLKVITRPLRIVSLHVV
nr:ribbon-helix-helix domain-containing protein [Marinicella sp. W31]MDC2880131.1 ribbon-helix-helix domain-containing protein [Marinicella sp. W31]